LHQTRSKTTAHFLHSTIFHLQFHRYPTSIAALDFSADGKSLAIASSYTMEEGEKECVAKALGWKRWKEVAVF
jgi:cell cycle arrest protein BUB3